MFAVSSCRVAAAWASLVPTSVSSLPSLESSVESLRRSGDEVSGCKIKGEWEGMAGWPGRTVDGSHCLGRYEDGFQVVGRYGGVCGLRSEIELNLKFVKLLESEM